MTRTAYVSLCMQQPEEWLREVVASGPTTHMPARYICLMRVALRRMGSG